MKTSYFANIKNLEAEGFTNLVSISQGESRWHKGKYTCFKMLAPSWDLIKEVNENTYSERYIEEVLSNLDAQKIYDELGEDAVLLCFEKPDDFCHRHIVAEWFELQLGIVVPEFVQLAKKEKGQVEQLSLFSVMK